MRVHQIPSVRLLAAGSTAENVQLPYLPRKEMVDADLVMLNPMPVQMRILRVPTATRPLLRLSQAVGRRLHRLVRRLPVLLARLAVLGHSSSPAPAPRTPIVRLLAVASSLASVQARWLLKNAMEDAVLEMHNLTIMRLRLCREGVLGGLGRTSCERLLLIHFETKLDG